ncbi:ATP-grasp domain-containing protein [Vibrio sp. S17_S38]|uniref:ATP-grasp domain-containing protein n=1 Tax=Vibrio sp. S17_S38 TaxID=2720229 RepID=UPI0016813A78|nr:ATP-grasp domain-containing protein [Vibrio sp. S17_S38]MBD1574815.1 ATP-grasp domain-containing protein [Vibrio sp. S17_S38]
MNFVLIEALTFGLGKLVEAAESLNVNLTLLTYNPEIYRFELDKINSSNFNLIKINTFDKNEVIKQCNKTPNLRGIINLTDTWTNMATEVSEHFGFTGQNPISTKICRNKFLLRNTLCKNNLTKGISKLVKLNNPTYQYEKDLSNLKYPLIVKDPSGTGSKNVWFAENYDELINLILDLKNKEDLEDILLETYFTGTLYSAETISYKGETKLISISSRVLSDMPNFMEKAISLPIDLRFKSLKGVNNWINKILDSICYTDGFAHTEFIVTKDGFEVVEVNPRLGGVQIGEALCQAFDYNFYKAFLEMAMNKRPEVLDMTLDASTYTGQVFIYAKEQGVFSHIDSRYMDKDKSTIYPCAYKGKEIKNLNDQSACVAILLTKSDSTESALLDVLSEANKIKTIME